MGEGILDRCRKRIKPNWRTAFYAALLIGLMTHIYKFTNTLPGHDALYNTYSANNIVSSGRWFLAVACAPGGFYDLPWINGLLSLFWIGLTAAVIADIFNIKSKPALVLTGGLLAAFPCITNTFFFEFTADGYMLSMLLAALTVRLSTLDTNWKRLSLAVVCICFSCGIYQAYVSFALVLAVCFFMQELMKNDRTSKEYLRWILNQIIVFGAGMLAYYVIWKLCMAAQHVTPGGYQGIDRVGTASFSLAAIAAAVKETARILAQFFFSRNVFQYGWTLYSVMNLVFLLGFAAVFIVSTVKSGLFRRPLHLVLALLCIIAIPLFVCIWLFVSPELSYHLLMLQSLSVLYIFALVLFEKYTDGKIALAASLFFALLVFKFSVQANACYFQMDKSCQRTEATAIEMLTRVHMMDDGSVEYIAIVGGGDSSLVSQNSPGIDEILVNAHQIRPNLIFNQTYGMLYLNNMMGSDYEPLDESALQELAKTQEVQEMAEWPMKDSVKIIGSTAVIKLPDPAKN